VITAGIASKVVDPFSISRLAVVTGGIVLAAFVITYAAVWRIERTGLNFTEVLTPQAAPIGFGDAVREMLADPAARHFTIFVFLSMLAYSMQDMILEPFSGLMFGFTPGQSTGLSGIQHSGVLLGMILVGIGGSAFGGGSPQTMRRWIFGGCIGSAVALVGLACAARVGPGWPLTANIFALGFANGLFAVAAIGAMMGLAGAGGPQREGIRMGVWGASQAIAFGLGGLIGAVGVDIGRAVMGTPDRAFIMVFSGEAMLFLVAAALSLRVTAPVSARMSTLRFEEVPA
jgi:BCD family chlorophyll transporter-like MFS transporter